MILNASFDEKGNDITVIGGLANNCKWIYVLGYQYPFSPLPNHFEQIPSFIYCYTHGKFAISGHYQIPSDLFVEEAVMSSYSWSLYGFHAGSLRTNLAVD